MNTEPTTCRNCGNNYTGSYCNICGQKKFDAHDKSIAALAEEILHFFTHFESAFFRTVKTILVSPGKLSADYCNGVRQKYYRPISLYLLIIFLYLIFPIAKGLNTPLTSSGYMFFKPVHTIEKKLQDEHTTIGKLSVRYHQRSERIAEVMLLILLPLSVLALAILYPRKGFIYDHFILATEINTFVLVFAFIIIPIAAWILLSIANVFFTDAIPKANYEMQDIIGTFCGIASIFIFTVFSFKRFYQSSYVVSIAKAVLFLLAYIFIFSIYRIALFYTVMSLI